MILDLLTHEIEVAKAADQCQIGLLALAQLAAGFLQHALQLAVNGLVIRLLHLGKIDVYIPSVVFDGE